MVHHWTWAAIVLAAWHCDRALHDYLPHIFLSALAGSGNQEWRWAVTAFLSSQSAMDPRNHHLAPASLPPALVQISLQSKKCQHAIQQRGGGGDITLLSTGEGGCPFGSLGKWHAMCWSQKCQINSEIRDTLRPVTPVVWHWKYGDIMAGQELPEVVQIGVKTAQYTPLHNVPVG